MKHTKYNNWDQDQKQVVLRNEARAISEIIEFVKSLPQDHPKYREVMIAYKNQNNQTIRNIMKEEK